jgi:hypothetical protein
MPENLYSCFKETSPSGLIFWNFERSDCFTLEGRKLKLTKTDKGNTFVELKYLQKTYKFFPNFSPLPVNDDLTKDEASPIRIFNRSLFEKKPHLFLFGTKAIFYRKGLKKWKGHKFNKGELKLPWMNFKIRLVEHFPKQYPVKIPVYTRPIHDNGKIIEGDISAIKIKIKNKDYWVRSDAPLLLKSGQKELRFSLAKEEINLPYQITLDQFKMDKNPGTNDPASFESFVSLLDGRINSKAKKHHVYMNTPLKYDDFTFYQSSYFQIGPEQYASVLSVNFDPGRPIKYLGCILLVFGAIWHYIIRRKKRKKHL